MEKNIKTRDVVKDIKKLDKRAVMSGSIREAHTKTKEVTERTNSGEVQKIPAEAKMSFFNHTLDRRDFAEKKVRVTIAYDREKLQTRKNTVEHPFGTIKWYDGAHYFLLKGKKKVGAEMALSFLFYNLRRTLSIIGFEKLMAAVGKPSFPPPFFSVRNSLR